MKSGSIASWNTEDPVVSGIIAPAETKTTGTPGALAFAILAAAAARQCIWVFVEAMTGGRRFKVYVNDSEHDFWIDFKTTLAGLVTAGTGVQKYQRVGEDGRIVEFKAVGRTYTLPTGGVSGLNEAVDLQPSRRMNVGALIDKCLDMTACKGVYLDNDESINPDGDVFAVDATRAASLQSDHGNPVSVVVEVLDAVAPSENTGNPGAFI